MIDRDGARKWLQRRMAEHDLGVKNGTAMEPDVVALSALVLSVDERLDEIMHKLDRRCCQWLGDVAGVLKDKRVLAALVALAGAVVSGLAALGQHFVKVASGH